MSLRLYHESLLVGEIEEAHSEEGTWFGKFKAAVSDEDEGSASRMAEFIAFSRNWHTRLKAGGFPTRDEFEPFEEDFAADGWSIGIGESIRRALDKPPAFVDDGITWVY